MFDKSELRRSMLLEKSYLHDLFSSNDLSVGQVLASASLLQLNILLKILHFVTVGDIPLSKEAIEKLTKSKKAHFLTRSFKDRKKVRTFVNGSRANKIAVLTKISKSLPLLLER